MTEKSISVATELTDLPGFVLGERKTRAEVVEGVERLVRSMPNVIVTRTDAGTFGEVRNVCTEAEWHESARLIRIWRQREERGLGEILVVTSEIDDIPLAEEAALTAETMGNCVQRSWRLGSEGRMTQSLFAARVIIVVSGMKANLPPIVVEPANTPVVLVPRTSDDRAKLLDLLGFCAVNVTLAPINGGFRGGVVASLINRRWSLPEQ
jgi:pyridinium-3,5-biscarboxylic acid mononucleotide synthase